MNAALKPTRKISLLQRTLGISDREVTFGRRGFQPADPQVQQHLENAGRSFVHGYNMVLEHRELQKLVLHLDDLPAQRIGFAYEGAAMAIALLDRLSFRKNVLAQLLAGAGEPHAYMVIIGAGWAAARLPWVRHNLNAYLNRFDPVLKWLVLDGFGFHMGFFAWRKHIERQIVPRQLKGYARRAFDQGIGRCLWFFCGANPSRITECIQRFAEPRHSDLWSGVGLACCYAGGVSSDQIEQLMVLGKPFRAELAQGVAFGAKARLRADNVVPHTSDACEIICGCSASQAADVTDKCLGSLPATDDAYEIWRLRIQGALFPETKVPNLATSHLAAPS